MNCSDVASTSASSPPLRQHKQQVLVGQEDELALTEASALPLPGTILDIDAREDGAVEAEGMTVMNDEVTK